MLRMIDKFAKLQKEKPEVFEATRFVQERVDLYFDENSRELQRSDAEYNMTGRSLAGQLITFSTLVIGLTSLIFAQDKILSHLNNYQKGFLFVGLISLFLSILAGALEHWDAMRHFRKISTLYQRANSEAPIHEAETTGDLHKFKKSLFIEISPVSQSRGLILQLCLLSFGAVLYLILFATIIY